jgi:hypothetical protein
LFLDADTRGADLCQGLRGGHIVVVEESATLRRVVIERRGLLEFLPETILIRED